MRFRFTQKKLAELYYDNKGARDYSEAIVDGFHDVMSVVEAAPDERELYAFKSFHYEKLKGGRGKRGERSLRLKDGWRLIVRPGKDEEGKIMLVIGIEDYHK